MHFGQDLSIGYLGHDSSTVELLSHLSSEPAPTCRIRSGVQHPSAAAWSAAVTPVTRAGVSALAGAATAVMAAGVTSTTSVRRKPLIIMSRGRPPVRRGLRPLGRSGTNGPVAPGAAGNRIRRPRSRRVWQARESTASRPESAVPRDRPRPTVEYRADEGPRTGGDERDGRVPAARRTSYGG
ncbi:MAG TPA: hypothetical protein VG296_18145 [Actinospica sp.]|nr:hypothetical protein [Actinospica sp.]HWG26039.1 hypothetical protein [Actinospica sp.]